MKKQNLNLARLVQLLNDGHFHDGTSIGEHLGMTRSAVWKSIHKLTDYGVAIESVKGRGYLMPEPLYLLDAAKIKRLTKLKKLRLQVFNSIASTNDYLKLKPHRDVQICLAEHQSAGKGRLQRTWQSPFAQNLYLSYAFPFQKDLSELGGLSLMVSMAIVAALESLGVSESILVKWPNDIVYRNPSSKQLEKLAGSLIEVTGESNGISHVIIGIGLNVNMLDATHIDQPWTSLRKITTHLFDRNVVAAKIIDALEHELTIYAEHGFKPFMQRWLELDCLQGHHITIQNLGNACSGKVQGINAQGNLLVMMNGKQLALSAGDVSIRKN